MAWLAFAPLAYGSGATSQRDVNPTGGVLANGFDGLRMRWGSNSQFQVNLAGNGQVYEPNSTPQTGSIFNSVYLRVDRGTNATTNVYTSADNAVGAPFSTFTQVSQSAIGGSGTAASPWVVTTVLRPSVAADNGITVTLTDTYVLPQSWFTRRVALTGMPSTGAALKFYQNVDTYLQGGDEGPGLTRTSPGNTSGVPDVVGVIKNNQFEALWYKPSSGTPIWDRYYTAYYADAATLICNGTITASNPCVTGTGNLDNTVNTNPTTNNGMAVQWNVPAGSTSFTVEYRVTFAMGAVDLTKAFNPATIALNGVSTLTFDLNNKTVNSVAGMNFLDTLPSGVVVASTPNIRTNCPAGGTLGTTFPAGMTVTAAAGSGTIQLAGGLINGAASAGGQISCQIAVNVTSAAAGVYHNTNASIGGIGNLNNLVGDEVLAVAIPQLVAGESVSGTLVSSQTGAASDGYYQITVQNNGTGPTFGTINLVDNLPAGITATAVSSSSGTVNCGTLPAGGTLSCTFTPTAPIGIGGSAVMRINVAIPSATTGSLTNVVTIGGGGDPDPLPVCPNAGNPQCAQTTTPVAPGTDLSITKTDGMTSVNAGGTVIYTIVVSNAGLNPANGTVFTDPAIANLTVASVACGTPTGGAACPSTTNTTVASMQGAGIVILTLPPGSSVTFTVTGSVGASATGNISNTANIAPPSGTIDFNINNNSATDIDIILPAGTPPRCGTLWGVVHGSTTTTPPGNILVSIDPTTGAVTNQPSLGPVTLSPDGPSNVSSLAIDPRTGRLFAVDNFNGNLETLAPNSTTWTNTGQVMPAGFGGNQYTRAIMDGSGNLYIGANANTGNTTIYRYSVTPSGVISGPTLVTVAYSGGTSTGPGGDFVIGPNGTFYILLDSSGGLSPINVYSVSPSIATGSAVTAAFVGTISGPNSGDLGGASYFGNRFYWTSTTSTKEVLSGNSATGPTTVLNATNVPAISDLATCVGSATVQFAKISNGNVGLFSYTGLTNLTNNGGTALATDSIITTTAGGQTTSSQVGLVTALGSTVSVTETVPTGWTLGANAVCTDANSAISGNPATFAVPLNGSTLTIPAANIVASAQLTCTFTNQAVANVTLTKTGPATATRATNYQYTLTVMNGGSTTTAANVAVQDQLPSGVTATAVSGASCTNLNVTGALLTCTVAGPLGTTNPGNTASFTLTVSAANTGSTTNYAATSSLGDGANPPSAPGSNCNNPVTAPPTSCANAPTTVNNAPNVILSKAFSPLQIPSGGTSTLTITIANTQAGAVALTGLTFSDNFPAGMAVASMPAGTQCGGSVTVTNGTPGSVSLTGGSLAAGATCQIQVIVTAP